MTSRREQIMVRLLAIIGNINGIEFSARNFQRTSETALPAVVLYDQNEPPEPAVADMKSGDVANLISAVPTVVVSVAAVPEEIGTLLNEWLAKVQKAVLMDQEIDALCGGRTAQRRIPNGGVRYVGFEQVLSEGRATELNLSVFFEVKYPLIPAEL